MSVVWLSYLNFRSLQMRSIQKLRKLIPIYEMSNVYPDMHISEGVQHSIDLDQQCSEPWLSMMTPEEAVKAQVDLDLNAWFATLPLKHKEQMHLLHRNPWLLVYQDQDWFEDEIDKQLEEMFELDKISKGELKLKPQDEKDAPDDKPKRKKRK